MARKLFTNARVVTGAEVFLGTVELHAGRIVRVDLGATSLPGAEDCDGDFLLPGLVDLRASGWRDRLRAHGLSSTARALVAHDLESAVNGITTACDVVPGAPPEALRAMAEAIRAEKRRGGLRIDHWLHVDAIDVDAGSASSAFASSLVRCLSVGSRDAPARALSAPWLEQAREHRAVVFATGLSSGDGVRLAAETGAAVCARPPSVALARVIARHGMLCSQPADDLLAGLEHPDRARRASLARHRLVDLLVTDGPPLPLLQAPFLLRDALQWPLPLAVTTVSSRPAGIAGFADRGSIAVGLRADLVRVRDASGLPVPVAVWRAGERIA